MFDDPSSGTPDVHRYVARVCFKTGPPGSVGIESEWLVLDRNRPLDLVPIARIRALLAAHDPLPAGSVVSFEPGGQLELSTPPLPGPAAACAALTRDLAHVRRALAGDGLALLGIGLEPHRSPTRQLDLERYRAMEAFFDARGPAGRAMMRSTASVQVCVDVGADPVAAAARWRRAHLLEPVLVAAFANSPLHHGQPTGWRSTRRAIWARIAGTHRLRVGLDPVAAWAEYLLDAEVMLVRHTDRPWRACPGVRFRDWLATPVDGRLPTWDDLDYHCSTLFPSVRPRGWLEIRYLDALPDEWWPVAVAVTTALLDDEDAALVAERAATPVAHLTLDAARHGLTHPEVATAAQRCFTAALAALPRLGAAALVSTVTEYQDRYVNRRRTPADDVLAEATTSRPLAPASR